MEIKLNFRNNQVDDKYRVNRTITSLKIQLIDQNGTSVGMVDLRKALSMAAEVELDLVEIANKGDFSVCKILDFGKMKYELQKKKNEAKKKQVIIEVKEIKLTPVIGEHDYQVKLSSMTRFLSEGNKVKVTMRFRGREVSHQDLGLKVLSRVKADLAELCKVDSEPRLEGRQMMMMLSSSAAVVAASAAAK